MIRRRSTLQNFIRERVQQGLTVYTDDSSAYHGLYDYQHELVCHSADEFVRDMAHTHGIQSFWAMLKRSYKGTFHQISFKHFQRYVNEFAFRKISTICQMTSYR